MIVWDSEHAQAGYAYLSANAGALRLLVPAKIEHMIPEMKTGNRVEIEVEGETMMIFFDDGTDTPFALQMSKGQTDRAMTPGENIPFTVWTKTGCVLRLTAKIILL